MDCRYRPFGGGAHPDQDEGGSDGAAECASEKICETTGIHHGRNSGSHGCGDGGSQRDSKRHRRARHSSGNDRQSDSGESSDCLSFSGGFALGDCQNASVSFCVGGTKRHSRAGQFPGTRGIHGPRCNTDSGSIRFAPHQDAPLSARIKAFAVDCTIGSSRSFARRDCHGTFTAGNVSRRKSRDATQA